MPESVGKTLKKIRESKQLSIQDVSERIRIPKKILLAIEEDRLYEVSSIFYAREFVKSYSQFLGALDEKVVKEYLTGSRKKDRPVLVLEGERVPGDLFRKHKAHIGIGLLIVFVIWALFFSFLQARKFVRRLSAGYKTHVAEKRQKATVSSRSKDALRVRKAQEGVAKGPEKIEGLKLEIAARNNTWIELISDGELLFKGILRKGTSDIWKAKKEIRVELGNAGAVTLKLNEEDTGPPGRKGEKKKLVITRDGIKD